MNSFWMLNLLVHQVTCGFKRLMAMYKVIFKIIIIRKSRICGSMVCIRLQCRIWSRFLLEIYICSQKCVILLKVIFSYCLQLRLLSNNFLCFVSVMSVAYCFLGRWFWVYIWITTFTFYFQDHAGNCSTSVTWCFFSFRTAWMVEDVLSVVAFSWISCLYFLG
jgi:hypothetical protein